jgi:hypothetical protein
VAAKVADKGGFYLLNCHADIRLKDSSQFDQDGVTIIEIAMQII